MRTPPAKRKQQGDKYELSPNSLAKCTKCSNKINKGEKRVGKKVYEKGYSDYIHRYYHDQCFPALLKEQLKLQAATPEDELMRAVKQEHKQKSIVHERRELYEALRTLRRGFARDLHCENRLYMVFENKTLEEMTIKMPKNQQDMIENVYGMGKKKYESFGDAFLQEIQRYARKYTWTNASTAAGASRSSTGSSGPVALFATGTTQVDDVVPLESPSCTRTDIFSAQI
jgi:superfamily II DNA helicase RecQ